MSFYRAEDCGLACRMCGNPCLMSPDHSGPHTDGCKAPARGSRAAGTSPRATGRSQRQLEEARKRRDELTALLDAVQQDGPYEITRAGKPVAVVVSYEDYLALKNATG